MKLASIRVDHYDIPLPEVLSDSTHGDISRFALVTVQVTDTEGARGEGYTYTVGNIGGSAVASLLRDDLQGLLKECDPRCIEATWQKMWWHLHFVGRGGLAAIAKAAADVALWDLKAVRAGEPLWRMLGGHANRVNAYAGGIDLMFTIDQLMAQTASFLEQGFGAIKMKVARLAEAANLPVTSHGVHDLHVHLLAAVPNASYLEVHGFGLERFMAEPLRIEEHQAVAPERPGRGVVFDRDALEVHRVS